MGVTNAKKAKESARGAGAQPRPLVGPPHDRRLGELCKLLPLTNRVLGRRFHEVYTRYEKEQQPSAVRKHLGDALAFALFLERTARRERFEPRWLIDLLRYEKSRIKASDPRRRVVACLFRHDISRLVRSVARREDETVALRKLCAAVWMRPRRGEAVRYVVLMLPKIRKKEDGS
jgi:hypothetical protein